MALLFLSILISFAASHSGRVEESPPPSLSLMFWNVENFFSPGEMEGKAWTPRRFNAKCNAVAKTILLAGETYGGIPDFVGLAETGDAAVLRSLVHSTVLRKLDYGFIHYDSPDRRGIDCALMYRKSRFEPERSRPCHLYDSVGNILPTRDILLVEGRMAGGLLLAVLVNHHPSKIGPSSGSARKTAMYRLAGLADSLKAAGIRHIVAVGDFNDQVATAPSLKKGDSNPGTIKFQGKWEVIDGCPLLEGLEGEVFIYNSPHLSTKDAGYGGEKPFRTFSGPRYAGGVSDHYPIFLKLIPSEPDRQAGSSGIPRPPLYNAAGLPRLRAGILPVQTRYEDVRMWSCRRANGTPGRRRTR